MTQDRFRLLHIRDAAEKIIQCCAMGRSEFISNWMAQDAVARNLEIIGEAVKSLSIEIRERHPHIPWRQIAGMRNRAIHEYFRLDPSEVWNVAQHHVPPLLEEVQKILGHTE